MNIIALINDCIDNFIVESIIQEWDDDIIYDLYEQRDEIMRDTINAFMNAKPNQRQPWGVVPFNRLKKIWEDAAKFGFVRDEKGLDMIQNKMITNLLKLDVTTEILGHSTSYPYDEIEDAGYSREEFEAKLESDDIYYFEDPQSGQFRLSDYGLKPLWNVAEKLTSEKDPIRRIMYIDQMLNIVHQRSDLAAMFVEGGTASLETISGQGERNYQVHRPM